MIALYSDTSQPHSSTPLVTMIFGIGLLGSAIFKNIKNQNSDLQYKHFEFDWFDKASQKQQLENILKKVSQVTDQENMAGNRIAIIWSAGNAGFNSERTDLDIELENFKSVLKFSNQLKERNPECEVEFHLISSAGGIFEGCGYVDTNTEPNPMRPYGEYKLVQEQILLSQNVLVPRIYRPSTVYGPIRPGLRSGLVSSLIRNGALRLVTNILGHLHTLRDYVHSDDIGNFVVKTVTQNKSGLKHNIFHLASGKPTSIFEVISIIERILKNRIYYKLEYTPENSCDIVFSPSLYPNEWSPTALMFGCQQVLYNWKTTIESSSY